MARPSRKLVRKPASATQDMQGKEVIVIDPDDELPVRHNKQKRADCASRGDSPPVKQPRVGASLTAFDDISRVVRTRTSGSAEARDGKRRTREASRTSMPGNVAQTNPPDRTLGRARGRIAIPALQRPSAAGLAGSLTREEEIIRQTFQTRLCQVNAGRTLHANAGELNGVVVAASRQANLSLVNELDNSTPPVTFQFIDECILRDGVKEVDAEAMSGCTCRPENGRHVGCEYTSCECLEQAAERADGKKRFPYYCTGPRTGCLQDFYLNSRNHIFECNKLCNCPPHCKNKVVQWGRTVKLEIFKTGNRGWGLRCPQDLLKGQFIDIYKGEIITSEEADKREEERVGKDSYLYSLDKFAESMAIPSKDLYVVDGEFYGGVCRFMNHSCDPNCRQFTVSYNHADAYLYDIALFAVRFIPAGTELTFNYCDTEATAADEGGNKGVKGDASGDDEEEVVVPVKRGKGRRSRRAIIEDDEEDEDIIPVFKAKKKVINDEDDEEDEDIIPAFKAKKKVIDDDETEDEDIIPAYKVTKKKAAVTKDDDTAKAANRHGHGHGNNEKRMTKCLCGAKNCRGYLWI